MSTSQLMMKVLLVGKARLALLCCHVEWGLCRVNYLGGIYLLYRHFDPDQCCGL